MACDRLNSSDAGNIRKAELSVKILSLSDLDWMMNNAPLHKEDLRALAEVGKALWLDPQQSRAATLETLGLVSLMDLTPDRAVEKAAAALLERVTSRGDVEVVEQHGGQPHYPLLVLAE